LAVSVASGSLLMRDGITKLRPYLQTEPKPPAKKIKSVFIKTICLKVR
jgi:hypothetical protein